MMTRNILIGLGAGLAAALLFASIISGTILALPLFLLTPLPVAIAGIGFGTWSGAAAAGLAAALVGVAFNPIAGLLHLVVLGAPVAWAAHLVGLSRLNDDAPDAIEWFPLGMVLARLSLAVGVAVIAAGILIGFDAARLTAEAVSTMQAWLASGGTGADVPTADELQPLISLSFALVPASSGCLVLAIAALNLWLAGHVVRLSGLARRPWTPMWLVEMPSFAAPVFGVAFVAAFLPGVAGQVAAAIAGAVGFAFALSGFGALHAILRGRPGRFTLLFVVYAMGFVFAPALFVMAIFGLADSLFHFRQRRLAGGVGPSS